MFRRDRQQIRSLEINLTAHCNLKCYGCGRGSPALPEEFLSAAELQRDLRALTKVLHAQEFKLAGGEPLLHPELIPIIEIVRASGVADKITLITNGLLLHQYGEELWQRIDEIWLSAYPGVKRVLSQDDVLALGKRHGVIIEYNFMNTFTRRLLNTPNRDPQLVQDIFDKCYQRSGCHSLYRGKVFQCASGPFIPKWLEQVGINENFSADGVALHGPGSLRKRLKAYYARRQPLAACTYCLGGIGREFENRQLTRAGVQEWREEKHDDLHELVDDVQLRRVQDRKRDEAYENYGQRINLP